MFKVIANRLEQGHKTSRYPQEAIELSRRFRGLPEIDAACDPALVRQCAESCPQQAILVDERRIDLGRCTFCGLCEQVSKGAFVRFTNRFELGAARREDLMLAAWVDGLPANSLGLADRVGTWHDDLAARYGDKVDVRLFEPGRAGFLRRRLFGGAADAAGGLVVFDDALAAIERRAMFSRYGL